MFLYRYLLHPKQTGAVCSSSSSLSKTITQNIDLNKAKNIIELGSGTGAFTKQILKQKNPQACFFAVEINTAMADKLIKKFPDIDLEIDSLENLSLMMKKRSMQKADRIICGIPWALLSDKKQDQFLKIIYEALEDDGIFTSFAYILPSLPAKRFRKKIFKLFKEVKLSRIVWNNIPPAFVYYCKK